ncbi:ABC transporter permease subunit [Paenibacillus paridis]|uniref:ABC transporter permease subunit n=1 Tax=Paenibacillus paridis TaxID=2583376 RepID=UPI001EE45854|nr:ABC transporter permease subunit [Paenibacillus paridis]
MAQLETITHQVTLQKKTQKKKGIIHSLVHQRTYWIMLIPSFIFFILFAYLPMIGVYIAFTRYDYGAGIFGSKFIGFQNFEYLFGVGTEGGFWSSPIWMLTRNTLLYNLAILLLGTALQVVVAITLKELPSKKFRKSVQTAMFLPYFISFAVVGVIAYNLLSTHGFINTFLTSIGVDTVNFYQEPQYWPYIIVLFAIWKGLGYGTVVYFAALSGFDESVYEAAHIDGATLMQRIMHITLPLLRPTIIILTLFSLGGILKGQFDLFYNLVRDNSLLLPTTNIIDLFVYRAVAISPNIGLGSAAGFYQSLFGLVLVVLVNWVVKKIEPDNALF